jgi:hypothetical protein
MKLKIESIILLLLMISVSCKKEDKVIVAHADGSLLTKVKISDQPYYEYLYNGANLISEEKSKFIFTLHRYNDKNQLVANDYFGDFGLLSSDSIVVQNAMNRKEWVSNVNSQMGGTLSYEYNINGQLINSVFSWPLISNQDISEFTYDINNRIVRQTLKWEGKVSGYIDYQYDGKGNLNSEILYSVTSGGVAELSTTTSYEFDNYQNPYKSFSRLMIPGINTNQNNIIKETYTIHVEAGQGADIIQTTIFTYTYNSAGFPIKKNASVEYIY